MKKKLFFLTIVITTTFFSLQGQDCIKCDSTSINSGELATALGGNSSATGDYSFAGGENSEASGIRCFAFGNEASSTGINSFALGANSSATSMGSFAIGLSVTSSGTGTFAIGTRVEAKYALSFAIGNAPSQQILENNQMETMVIGFNSINPTLFIDRSPNSGTTYDKTGRVGIGNVTDPNAKLHIRSDDGEEATLLIEPNNWSAGEHAKLILGDTSNFIKVENNFGMEFSSQNNFIFSGNNSGFGIVEPKAKVHINGDLLFENNMNGIIMKSEDGNCWKGTISNNGELIFSQIDCATLTATENRTEPKHSEVFIYPNPTNGQMTVEYTGNRKNLRLEIKSISGLLVATYKINKGENRIELNSISDQMIVASVFTKKGELISTNKVVIKK